MMGERGVLRAATAVLFVLGSGCGGRAIDTVGGGSSGDGDGSIGDGDGNGEGDVSPGDGDEPGDDPPPPIEVPGEVDDQPWVNRPGAFDDAIIFSRLYYNGALYGTSGEELFVAGEDFYPEVFALPPSDDDAGSFVAVVGADQQLRAWRPFPDLPHPQVLATNEAGVVVIAGPFDETSLEFDGHALWGVEHGGMYVLWLNRDLDVTHAATIAGDLFPNDGALAADGSLAIVSTEFRGDNFDEDVHVVRFSPDRELVWERAFHGTDTSWGDKVEFLSDGSVAVVGAFSGSIDLHTVHVTLDYPYQGFATRLDGSTGMPLWDLTFGGEGYEYVTELNAFGTSMRIGGHIEGTGTVGDFSFEVPDDGGCFIAEIDPTGAVTWMHALPLLSGMDGMITVDGVSTAFVTHSVGLMQNDLVLWSVTESEHAISPVANGTTAYAEGLAYDTTGNLWFAVLFQESVTLPTGTYEHPRPTALAQATAFFRGTY